MRYEHSGASVHNEALAILIGQLHRLCAQSTGKAGRGEKSNGLCGEEDYQAMSIKIYD